MNYKEIFLKHSRDGFYFGEGIPEKKLKNAMQMMPIKGKVLALLDCTVFGSCKNGVAITDSGLYWSNDWTVDSSVFGVSWEEFSNISEPPFYKSYSIVIRPGVNIGISGCSFGKKELLSLFKDLHKMSITMINKSKKIDEGCLETVRQNKDEALGVEDRYSSAAIDGGQNAYDNATAYILALVTVADGVVGESEIEFAHDFIREEEGVLDKDETIKKYDASVLSLSEAKSKSMALFKIRANKLFSSVFEAEDSEFFNRISIMLEGMVEASGGFDNRETVKMVDMVLSRRLFSSSVNGGLDEMVDSNKIENTEMIKEAPKGSGMEIYNFEKEQRVEAGSDEGVGKYWPRLEKFVVSKLLDVADDKLNQPEELAVYFSKLHDILPVALRLVVGKDKFIDFLMSKRVVILEKVRAYEEGRDIDFLISGRAAKIEAKDKGIKGNLGHHSMGRIEESNAHAAEILPEAIKKFDIKLDEDPAEVHSIKSTHRAPAETSKYQSIFKRILKDEQQYLKEAYKYINDAPLAYRDSKEIAAALDDYYTVRFCIGVLTCAMEMPNFAIRLVEGLLPNEEKALEIDEAILASLGYAIVKMGNILRAETNYTNTQINNLLGPLWQLFIYPYIQKYITGGRKTLRNVTMSPEEISQSTSMMDFKRFCNTIESDLIEGNNKDLADTWSAFIYRKNPEEQDAFILLSKLRHSDKAWLTEYALYSNQIFNKLLVDYLENIADDVPL